MILQGLGKLLQQQQQSNKVQNHHSSEPFAISSFQPVSSGQKLVIGTHSLCGVPQSEDLVTTQIGLWTSIQVCHFECGYVAIWSQNFLVFWMQLRIWGTVKGGFWQLTAELGAPTTCANCLSVTWFNRLVHRENLHETSQSAFAVFIFLCDCMSINNHRWKRQWLVWHCTLTLNFCASNFTSCQESSRNQKAPE